MAVGCLSFSMCLFYVDKIVKVDRMSVYVAGGQVKKNHKLGCAKLALVQACTSTNNGASWPGVMSDWLTPLALSELGIALRFMDELQSTNRIQLRNAFE